MDRRFNGPLGENEGDRGPVPRFLPKYFHAAVVTKREVEVRGAHLPKIPEGGATSPPKANSYSTKS
jgi:hypothetical protein